MSSMFEQTWRELCSCSSSYDVVHCRHLPNVHAMWVENENWRWNMKCVGKWRAIQWTKNYKDADEMLDSHVCSFFLLFHHLLRRMMKVERVKNCSFMYETNCWESKVSNSKICCYTTFIRWAWWDGEGELRVNVEITSNLRIQCILLVSHSQHPRSSSSRSASVHISHE